MKYFLFLTVLFCHVKIFGQPNHENLPGQVSGYGDDDDHSSHAKPVQENPMEAIPILQRVLMFAIPTNATGFNRFVELSHVCSSWRETLEFYSPSGRGIIDLMLKDPRAILKAVAMGRLDLFKYYVERVLRDRISEGLRWEMMRVAMRNNRFDILYLLLPVVEAESIYNDFLSLDEDSREIIFPVPIGADSGAAPAAYAGEEPQGSVQSREDPPGIVSAPSTDSRSLQNTTESCCNCVIQ